MRGRLAVVAPVTASYGAIAALLSAATGERLSHRAGWGIAFTVCGVCLVSLPAGGRRAFRDHLHASGFGWAPRFATPWASGCRASSRCRRSARSSGGTIQRGCLCRPDHRPVDRQGRDRGGTELASAVTVLLSRLIDRAATALHQWLALGVVIAGLILIEG